MGGGPGAGVAFSGIFCSPSAVDIAEFQLNNCSLRVGFCTSAQFSYSPKVAIPKNFAIESPALVFDIRKYVQ